MNITRLDEIGGKLLINKLIDVKPNSESTHRIEIKKTGLLQINNKTILVGVSDSVKLIYRDDNLFELQGKFPKNFTIWQEIDAVRYPPITYILSKKTLQQYLKSLDSVHMIRRSILSRNRERISKDVHDYLTSYLRYSDIFFMLKEVTSANVAKLDLNDFSSVNIPAPSFNDFQTDAYTEMTMYLLAGQSLGYFVASKSNQTHVDLEQFKVTIAKFSGQTRAKQLSMFFSRPTVAKIPISTLDSLLAVVKRLDIGREDMAAIEKEYHKIAILDKPISKKIQLSTVLKDISGKEKSLADLISENHGKTIVIDFWASWCGPCMHEIPFTKKLKEKNKNIIVIYVSMDDKESDWISATNKLGIRSDQYLLSKNFKSILAEHLFISGIPRYVVLDKNGVLINPNAPPPSLTDFYNSL